MTEAALPPRRRLVGLAVAWTLIVLAGPGFLGRNGAAFLAPIGVAIWALVAARPGPRAFLCELLVGGIAWATICSWAAYVWWGNLCFFVPGMGFYAALPGVLLRRLARRHPLALAAPLAWVGVETLRVILEPPFGFGWLRLGTHVVAHAESLGPVAGSARVWGVGGLSFAVAAVAGAWADAWRAKHDMPRAARWLAASALPLALAALAGWLVPAPATTAGPRALLVQPGIPQERKMEGSDPRQLFAETRALTLAALARPEPTPDLVVWGETMLHTPLVDRAALAAAAARTVQADPWLGLEGGPEELERALAFWLERERVWVAEGLFGEGALPKGTVFVCGAEYFTAEAGRLRRQNAVVLWTGPGERLAPVGKRHLVPGAETLVGLERFGFARGSLLALASYVPDLLPGRGDTRLAFTARDGRRFVLGASVCFDNAFDDLYLEAARMGVDFHLVLSNEAWFRESQEFDQMVAFSRGLALATGRSVVRCTNSGISAVIDPRGRVTARLEAGGRDRAVRGTLTAVVPVPVDPATPPYVRFARAWTALWLLAPVALCLLRRRPVTTPAVPVREQRGMRADPRP